MSEKLPLDFTVLNFAGEANPGYGEDSWCYGFTEQDGLIAVFDGCGGSGGRRHEKYSNHTEAFIASRLCAGAMYEYIQNNFSTNSNNGQIKANILLDYIQKRLQDNAPEHDSRKGRISGLRTLPSTMAAAWVSSAKSTHAIVTPMWTGDSRIYVLTENGLSQMSIDDTNQPDPFENLYHDGVLTNVLCADSNAKINNYSVTIEYPFIVIVASDGCFGYVSTPMEFEGMILHTLLESNSVGQWESNLKKLTASFSGDDYTMCLASFGYSSFENLHERFTKRYDSLYKIFLEKIWQSDENNISMRRQLWNKYRTGYMKYIEGISK